MTQCHTLKTSLCVFVCTGGGWLLLGPDDRGPPPPWEPEWPAPEEEMGASPSSAMRERYSLSMRALSWADWGGSPVLLAPRWPVKELQDTKLKKKKKSHKGPFSDSTNKIWVIEMFQWKMAGILFRCKKQTNEKTKYLYMHTHHALSLKTPVRARLHSAQYTSVWLCLYWLVCHETAGRVNKVNREYSYI